MTQKFPDFIDEIGEFADFEDTPKVKTLTGA